MPTYPLDEQRTSVERASVVREGGGAYYREPRAPTDAITFVASRLKLTLAPILIMPLVLFPLAPLHLALRMAGQGHDAAPALIFFTVMLMVALGLEIFQLLALIFPPRIIVTTEGWSVVFLGRRTAYRWSDYQEPKAGRISNGRSSQPCIKLERRYGAKPLNLLTGTYPYALHDLVQVFQHARAGRLLEPNDAAPQWAYLFAWIPLTLGFVAALVAWLGPEVVQWLS